MSDEELTKLESALKSKDENTITNITMNHSTSERVKMREKYKSKFNRDLIDDIEKYTKSDLCTLLTSIYKDPVEYDTDLLYKAMKGIGTNDDILIEVISFRNFQRLSKIKEKFQEKYKKDLISEVKSETSGDYKDTLIALLEKERSNNKQADLDTCQKIAEELYGSGEGKLGTNESTFIKYFTTLSAEEISIVGKPNVGKSSLLNRLLKEERAIVTEVEGTTRDTIEEFISVEGIPFKIIDTAGIRETDDTVEKIGVKKAIEIAKSSDLILAIFDISRELSEDDFNILNILSNKNSIIILNKIDKNIVKIDEKILEKYTNNIIKMSTLEGEGLEELFKLMLNVIKTEEISSDNELITINSRHKELIKNAENSLEKAINTLNSGMPVDVISIYIKEILEELGKITGESVTEDVINNIFSRFCLGK